MKMNNFLLQELRFDKTLLIFFLALLCVNFGEPYASTTTDTAMEKCYNDTTEITCPNPGEEFYGQDASYKGLKAKFVDNGDGTVKDNLTYLEWEITPSCSSENNSKAGFYRDNLTYNDAVLYCDRLVVSGKDDWRIPTKKEMLTIYTFNNDGQAAVSVPFYGFDWWFGLFWTSTELNQQHAVIANNNFDIEYLDNSSLANVLCVRKAVF